jgi:motility quorum-sensing regulator/GCU-specific mRNA interferase toxin
MEKLTPHYSLEAVQKMVAALGARALTFTAKKGAVEMGLTLKEAVDVVLGLKRGMLHKSMTTYVDHRIWQDVYHAPCPNGKTAYIKVTQIAEVPVIQFKEL